MTKTDQILDLLKRRPMTSEEICAAMGMKTAQVWGLMKMPLQRMKVKRTTNGFWALDSTYNSEIERGVAYLRSIGWTVTPPKTLK